jgi:predicted HTH transcriptional regulator
MGIVEHYGTGIKRVRNMFIDYGLKEPMFEMMSGGVAVTVFAENSEKPTLTDLKTDLKTDEIDYIILDLMDKDSQISIPEISEKIRRGLTATKERIYKLKTNGLIERIGADKGGYWKVKRS